MQSYMPGQACIHWILDVPRIDGHIIVSMMILNMNGGGHYSIWVRIHWQLSRVLLLSMKRVFQ